MLVKATSVLWYNRFLLGALNSRIYDFLIPSAHAWIWVAFVAIFVVLPAAVAMLYLHGLNRAADKVIDACEHRDDKVPYRDSEAFEYLQDLEANYDFDLEEQRRIGNCVTWAKEGATQHGAPSVQTLLDLCRKGEKILRCMDDYRNGVKRFSGGAAENPSDGVRRAAPVN
jgi:hypothetical protein